MDNRTDPARPRPALVLPAPRTSTGELLGRAAAWRGFDVLARPERPPSGGPAHWYGGPRAADRVAAGLGLALLEPADGWLAGLPYGLLRRRVRLTTLAEARALPGPCFVKPPSEKTEALPAAVYGPGGGARLPGPEVLDGATPVLVCSVVEFAAEYRLFFLDGEVVAGSRYAVYGRLDPAALDAGARAFGREVLAAAADGLPSAVCVDVGRLADGTWAVVEANMPWFAHCYAAEPERVLDVVLRAAGPLERVRGRDVRFLRGAA
ncbi:ATP-grasp domain-containing protein [Streptomyces sp. 2P-4]|uniref:ATP-grasp domain-containing protein n=1 Tax=Streptomyces sp. 2P-4 TaxID=2931974 RepID=UPI0025415DDD|nr:ATP-grasp domain-containing protein [Streptomyces sp. 2P-4]